MIVLNKVITMQKIMLIRI